MFNWPSCNVVLSDCIVIALPYWMNVVPERSTTEQMTFQSYSQLVVKMRRCSPGIDVLYHGPLPVSSPD